MKWTFQVSPHNISEYLITSSEGKMLSFKYSQLQRSIRMKYNDHRAVYMLDNKGFSAKKTFLKNVYGSEIGTISKSMLREHTGTVTLNDSLFRLDYKIGVAKHTIDISNEKISSTCHFSEGWNKEQGEMYMIAMIVLSWMYSVQTLEQVSVAVLH